MVKKVKRKHFISKVKRFGSRLGCPNGVRSYKPGEPTTTPERRKATISKYNNNPQRKEHMNAYARLYYAKNGESMFNARLIRTYGIDLVEYNKLLVKQKHSCYICKTHKDKFEKRLFVDHNHKTGKVRGLLCLSCNYAIGASKDSVIILKRMIKYLKENK